MYFNKTESAAKDEVRTAPGVESSSVNTYCQPKQIECK